MQPRIQRIEQNQSLLSKKLCEQFSKRTAVSSVSPITLLQDLRDRFAGRPVQQLDRLLHVLFNRRPQLHLPHGTSSRCRIRRKVKSRQLPGLKPGHMAYFIKIMILGSHPENRHRRNSRVAKLLRQPNRRKRLVDRVSRPTKQPDLLPTHDRHGPALEFLQIAKSRSARAQASILLTQNTGNFATALRWILKARRYVLHRIHIWRMRIEFL